MCDFLNGDHTFFYACNLVRCARIRTIAGTEKTAIPKKASPGCMSYKYPPIKVNNALLRLIANAAYNPWAVGIDDLCNVRAMN